MKTIALIAVHLLEAPQFAADTLADLSPLAWRHAGEAASDTAMYGFLEVFWQRGLPIDPAPIHCPPPALILFKRRESHEDIGGVAAWVTPSPHGGHLVVVLLLLCRQVSKRDVRGTRWLLVERLGRVGGGLGGAWGLRLLQPLETLLHVVHAAGDAVQPLLHRRDAIAVAALPSLELRHLRAESPHLREQQPFNSSRDSAAVRADSGSLHREIKVSIYKKKGKTRLTAHSLQIIQFGSIQMGFTGIVIRFYSSVH